MNWLVKEEPENYSYSQFAADKTTVWAGVRNPVAQRNLREMKKGDRVFFYHTGKEKAVIGTATVSKTAYPDPKDRQPGRRRARRRQGVEAPGHAHGDQGRQAIRDDAAGAHCTVVGAAGDR